jgi:hypothetical protein
MQQSLPNLFTVKFELLLLSETSEQTNYTAQYKNPKHKCETNVRGVYLL